MTSSVNNPEFIDTDLTVPVEESAAKLHSQVLPVQHYPGQTPIRHTMEVPTNQNAGQSQVTNVLSGARAAVPQLANVNVQLSSGQAILTQASPTLNTAINTNFGKAFVTPAGVLNTATSGGQATLISVNQQLGAGSIVTQPLQVLSAGPYQQVLSAVPARFTHPGAAALGSTVLMPVQQSSTNILQPGATSITRAQMLQATATMTKHIQPKPTNVVTLAPGNLQTQAVVTMAAKLGQVPTTVTTLAANMTGLQRPTQLSIPVSVQLAVQPRMASPRAVQAQVINIPKVPLPTKQAPAASMGNMAAQRQSSSMPQKSTALGQGQGKSSVTDTGQAMQMKLPGSQKVQPPAAHQTPPPQQPPPPAHHTLMQQPQALIAHHGTPSLVYQAAPLQQATPPLAHQAVQPTLVAHDVQKPPAAHQTFSSAPLMAVTSPDHLTIQSLPQPPAAHQTPPPRSLTPNHGQDIPHVSPGQSPLPTGQQAASRQQSPRPSPRHSPMQAQPPLHSPMQAQPPVLLTPVTDIATLQNMQHPLQLATTLGSIQFPAQLAPQGQQLTTLHTEMLPLVSKPMQLPVVTPITSITTVPVSVGIKTEASPQPQSDSSSPSVALQSDTPPAESTDLKVNKTQSTTKDDDFGKESVGSVDGVASTATVDDLSTPTSSLAENQLVSDIIPYGEDDQVPIEYDEPEFVWEEYLEESGATAAPPTSFKHVECSLQSGFVKGMKVEVPNKGNPNSYWVASVVMTCGPLLRLRYDGYGEDSSADFWSDVQSSGIHPIGWCAKNGKSLQPPEGIKTRYENWSEFLVKTLSGATTAPAHLLDGKTGTTPIEQIKQGMRLEVQDMLHPLSVWIVKIIENVGGRLLLRYEGMDQAIHDFWMFYLHHRIHPIGWAKQNECIYKPPDVIKAEHSNYSEWAEILQTALKQAEDMILPADIFKDQVVIKEHKMQRGYKLEALHPHKLNQICPATIVQVMNKKFFIVEFDDVSDEPVDKRCRICCHSLSPGLFPVNFTKWKGLRQMSPIGWAKPDFDWDDYMEETKSQAAPDDCFPLEVPDHEFKRGMKLEAVDPNNPSQISAATITKIIDRLMWIHLDSSKKIVATHIVDVESHDIFPVGWCESNMYPLKPPHKPGASRKNAYRKTGGAQQDKPMSADEFRSATYSQIRSGDAGNNSAWCPKIYFNHKCFSGPFLSKGRIAELPRCVGPGPAILVMKEILSMLINVAYKSSRVLREMQLEGPANPKMHQQVLKAKYKGKSYRAMVEICKSSDQIEEFCRQVCIKLECCPNLFSPHFVNGNCPENCSQLTKTKYTYYYGKKKKRKIGRPPGGHTNLENGPKKPGKRRKRKKVNLMARKKRESGDEEEAANVLNGDDDGMDKDDTTSESTLDRKSVNSEEALEDNRDPDFKPPKKKRKYTHHLPPPSEIKTRGAKLPKYSFERRTHKKILLAQPRQPSSHSHGHAHSIKLIKKRKKSITIAPKQAPKPEVLQLDTNPLNWTISEVVEFVKGTDCANLSRIFKDQEIDGQSLLLLTLPVVQELMELKLGPAIKLCHHIERVKIAFYEQYAK